MRRINGRGLKCDFFPPLYSFSSSRHRATHLLQKKTPTRQKGSHVENQSAPRDGHATNQVRCGRQDESKVVVGGLCEMGGSGKGQEQMDREWPGEGGIATAPAKVKAGRSQAREQIICGRWSSAWVVV